MCPQVGQAEIGKPGLAVAEQFSCTAQAQVLFGYGKPVLGVADTVEPGAGRFSSGDW